MCDFHHLHRICFSKDLVVAVEQCNRSVVRNEAWVTFLVYQTQPALSEVAPLADSECLHVIVHLSQEAYNIGQWLPVSFGPIILLVHHFP